MKGKVFHCQFVLHQEQKSRGNYQCQTDQENPLKEGPQPAFRRSKDKIQRRQNWQIWCRASGRPETCVQGAY